MKESTSRQVSGNVFRHGKDFLFVFSFFFSFFFFFFFCCCCCCLGWGVNQSINQSGAVLFSVGEHDLHVAVSASVTLPTVSHFVSPSNIFSLCCVFLRSFQRSHNILVSLFSSNGQPQRLLGVYVFMIFFFVV